MMNLKRVFVVFLLLVLLNMQAVFAVTDSEALELKDVFEDNHQSVAEASFVNNHGLSQVEQMFNGKESAVSGNILYQAGYNQFKSPAGSADANGRYDGNYKLTIGEKINVYAYGDSVDIMSMSGSNLLTPFSQTEVSSNGSIFISGLGLVKAENRSIKEVENDVNSLARNKYKSIRIRLTVSSGGEFPIFVYGEVNYPGKVLISNNSTLLDALGAAGGVKKTGTLRNIVYNKKNVDLYNTLFFGKNNGILVRPNDTIFVGKIGGVVAVKNGVKSAGIYEIKPNETVADVVKYAGGLLETTQLTDVIMVGFDKELNQKTARTVSWESVQGTKLVSGDTIEFKEIYNNAENTVAIQGNIKHPATYEYKEGMRLSDILKSEDEFLEETFVNQAVIRRISGDGNNVEIIPVFLKEFFSGMNDPVLKARDVITVYKSTNSSFVDVYGCINNPKHIPYMNNMSLKDVLSDIKFMESDVKSEDNNEFNTSSVNGDVKLRIGTDNTNKLIPTENIAVEITNVSGKTSIYYMYDLMISSDRIKSIKIQPEDKVFFRTLRSDEILKTVKVSGYVKDPGVFTFVKGQKLSDVIKLAGGLADDADFRGIVLKRNALKARQTDIALQNNERDIELLRGKLATGYKQTEADQKNKTDLIESLQESKGALPYRYNGQISLNIKTNDINKISKADNIEIQDGDDIYIPRMSNHISIIGEVYNEQSFIYRKGSTVKSYVKEVGGYTPGANKFRTYKVGVDGKAKKVHLLTKVEPGDTIIVPRKIPGNDWISPLASALQVVSSIFLMAFAVNKW